MAIDVAVIEQKLAEACAKLGQIVAQEAELQHAASDLSQQKALLLDAVLTLRRTLDRCRGMAAYETMKRDAT